MAREEARARVIEDSDTLVNMKVNDDGSINTVNVSISTPSTATAVVEENFASISSTVGVDTIYTITNTKTLTIQQFSSGSEAKTGGSVAEIFEDPNGDLSVLNRIDNIYTDGSTTTVPLGQDYVGDGTRRIVMRQRGLSSTSAREMFSRWQGFEE
jgi:hypothetical protein